MNPQKKTHRVLKDPRFFLTEFRGDPPEGEGGGKHKGGG
jgi:hypothetical protein